MGSGYSKMKKQAKMLQKQLSSIQENRQNKEITASAGNGLVTVTLTGDNKMKKIDIKRDCVDPDDIEGLQDLIISAYNEALSKINESEEMPSLGNLPF
jgi:DNA-binding YbaB/EbfC family protein